MALASPRHQRGWDEYASLPAEFKWGIAWVYCFWKETRCRCMVKWSIS